MNKTNAIVESRKRKIQELTDEFEEIVHKEILRDEIEELVEEEIDELEVGIQNQYDRITTTIAVANLIVFVVFSVINKRVFNKWTR